MNTQVSATGTVILVTAGTWAQGKPLTAKMALGSAVFFLSLSIAGGSGGGGAKLAEQFGTLVLIAAAIRYIPPIAAKTGLAKNAK